jgi:transcriptional regulator with XRE-family HTH domain
MAMYAVPQATTNPLRLREELHLSRERMARLMDVSAKTIERWETREALPANRSARERLSRIREITELGRAIYTEEGMQRFLTTPLPVFDGATALQMIENGQADRVLAALAADYEGLGG